MKTRIICLLIVLLPFGLAAQGLNFGSFYEKYSSNDGFTSIEVSGAFLKMIGNMSGAEGGKKGSSGALDKVESIRIVIADSPDDGFARDIRSLGENKAFNLITSVNSDGNHVRFLFKECKDGPNEFMMLMSGAQDNIAIHIKGSVDLNGISNLSGLGLKGIDNVGLMGN